ncbi:Pvc16 family protein [Streptomyces sp. WAC 00631]|uniref:DUF4255 domain-containing protein n=1 Tax=Streptomyces sp. WAC 00631 TaxID=2203201 RepID=UPI000F78AD00|nr:DUF4255 domain-containing protein [Streptomyces sp. WAC 00631]MCC5031702.1 Pvc16 family protein [Streptomyces sp. WAC 00631]
MSNALAIATVTQALAHLIANNLTPEFNEAVRVEPRKPPAEPPPDPLITVFCYQVTPNASMRGNDLPTRAADGTLVQRAAAALDLHYLISTYGEEAELVGQRLIGCVVRTLHEIPVLPRDVITQAAERPHLAGSDLADAVQKVRFTPAQMDIDETSKLWGMLHQTPYSLSVAYQASLVLIEGRELPVQAPPVERHTVRALPFGAPGAPVPPGGGTDPADGTARAGDPARAGGRAPVGGGASRAGRNPGAAAASSPARPRTASAAATASAASAPAAAGASARRTTARAGRPGAVSPAARTRPEEPAPATTAPARKSRVTGASPAPVPGTGRSTAAAPTGTADAGGPAGPASPAGTTVRNDTTGPGSGGADGAAGEQREG